MNKNATISYRQTELNSVFLRTIKQLNLPFDDVAFYTRLSKGFLYTKIVL